MELKLFDYELPKNLIAQKPLEKRDFARMMVMNKSTGELIHDYFYNLKNYLKKNDLIVLNDSKVIKCRIFGEKSTSIARIECFILEKEDENTAVALARPAKKLKTGEKIYIDKKAGIYFELVEHLKGSRMKVKFNVKIDDAIDQYGLMPLPPYIKERGYDENYYQTVYASKPGSVAAPTAGLHFTKSLIKKLKEEGISFADITLDIGMDTFKPITEDQIENHMIHSEKFSISKKSAELINKAKSAGSRIVASGTTSVRALESASDESGCLHDKISNSELFIYPGYDFKIVDAMITNFHLPKSSLLVLVCAFAGYENILKAYQAAIKNNYRFFSFGDCMLII